jgi:diguanylate cyclase (GGDEF)-like protein/PAS domain S-box-containing protein
MSSECYQFLRISLDRHWLHFPLVVGKHPASKKSGPVSGDRTMKGIASFLMSKTDSEFKLQSRLRLFTLIAFILALIVSGAFAFLALHARMLQKQRTAEIVAANQSAILEERLSRSLSSTYALAAVVRQGGGNVDNFNKLATEMLKVYGGISSLQLAPNGVISQVVPLTGNEKAIGHDLLKDRDRNKEAYLALNTRKLTLAGPFNLVQGGVAVIGRLPIFLPDVTDQETFWGFATALIRIPDLLATSSLPQLSQTGYQYELARIHPDTGQRQVFAQSGKELLKTPVVRTLEVPNGRWFLSLEPEAGWVEPSLTVIAVAATFLVAFSIAFFTYTVFKQPIILRREVRARTRELAEANHHLNLEIVEREQAQEEVIQINRLYSVLSHTNAAIVRISDQDLLLQEVCRIAVVYGGFSLAKIAMFDAPSKTWVWASEFGNSVELPECAHALQACMQDQVESLHKGVVKVCSRVRQEDPAWSALCQQARGAGFESHVILQFKVGGKVVGAFSLYAYEANFFDDVQLKLLEEMTADVSFALENMVRETLRKQGEDNLRKLSRAVEQSANAVMIANYSGVIEYVNPWFSKMTGYPADEIISKRTEILMSDRTPEEIYQQMTDTLLSGKEWTGELQRARKNGDLYWCLETISPLKNDAGKVTHFVSITEDISERKQAEETIRHLAFHDALTGLPNRRLFRDRLHQAAAVSRRSGTGFALMLLDLDRFKTVNDTLGHDIGDGLLTAVAERLIANTREGDTLARMGGDEFALIAIDLKHPEEMVHLAEKLLNILQSPFNLQGHELYVSTSIGITLFPADTEEVDVLVKNADIALYHAKDQGRNNFQFFTGDTNAAMLYRLALESSMRWALERNEFLLNYQPQMDILTGHIHGTEALIRWQHPEFGLVAPAQFIPLAEETGLIVPIGEWVLRTACAQAKAWDLAGMPMRVSVNLSARQFRQRDLAERIGAILQQTCLSPALLEVELTEGILMEDTAETGVILDKLHGMGVQISIDDFGTGYSSLSYLKRLPIQILKIDQSFVRDINTDPDDRAIVTAVIALAHSLKLKVVAEGVETQEQLSFLQEQDCDIIQGYLYSRPVTGDEVEALMKTGKILTA